MLLVLFSAEQEVHFERRYNEGFNLLIDPDYLEWLKLNHPEAELLTDHTVVFSVGYAILVRKYALRGTVLCMQGGIIGGI